MKARVIKKVNCNVCGEDSDYNTIVDYKVSKVSNLDDIRLVYFICPKCYEVYVISILDSGYESIRDSKDNIDSPVTLKSYLDVLASRYSGKFYLNRKTNEIYYHEENMEIGKV